MLSCRERLFLLEAHLSVPLRRPKYASRRPSSLQSERNISMPHTSSSGIHLPSCARPSQLGEYWTRMLVASQQRARPMGAQQMAQGAPGDLVTVCMIEPSGEHRPERGRLAARAGDGWHDCDRATQPVRSVPKLSFLSVARAGSSVLLFPKKKRGLNTPVPFGN